MKLHEIFAETVNVLNTRGWCKGNCSTIGGGPVCIMLALRIATKCCVGYGAFTSDYFRARDYLAASIGVKRELEIYYWNDAPERTKWGVISKLLTLVAICKAQEESAPTEETYSVNIPDRSPFPVVYYELDSVMVVRSPAEEAKGNGTYGTAPPGPLLELGIYS